MVSKIARILVIIVAGIVVLNILLFLIFSVPSIQKRAADFALEKIEPVIDTNVSLDGIRIRLFNKVQLDGLYVEGQQEDTLLYVGSLTTRILPWNLLSNRVAVQELSMKDFTANVYRESPEDHFNFQFIIDAFAKEKDTTEVQKDKKAWRITADKIVLENGKMSWHINSVPRTPGTFNASHMDVEGFHFKGLVDFNGIGDMSAEVSHFELLELSSGIAIDDLVAHFRSVGTRLESDHVDLSFNSSDLSVKDAYFDTDTKEVGVKVNSDRLDPGDMALFTSRLAHLNKPVSFDLSAEGVLPQVSLEHIEFRYGNDTKLDISASISDFSNLDASDLNADIRSFAVSQGDLETFIQVAAPEYLSPEQLLALGKLNLNMKAIGKLGNFRYDGVVNTERGDVSLNGRGHITNSFKHIRFEGPVAASNIEVGNIIGDDVGVGNTTLVADAGVVIKQQSGVTVTAKGAIEDTSFKGYSYNDLLFDATYSGTNVVANISTDTELNNFDIIADIAFGDEMRFGVDANVERLDMRPFVMMEGWQMPTLATRINGRLEGSSIDNLTGNLVVDQTSLTDSSFFYNPGPIYLQALPDAGEGKKIEIMSSPLEAEIVGDYYFSTIGKELMRVLKPHLPSLINDLEMSEDDNSEYANEVGNNDFRFNFTLKNTEDLSFALSLPFYNVEHATISGQIKMDDIQPLTLKAHVPRLISGNNDIRETKIDLYSNDSGLGLDVNSYLVQDKGHVNVRLHSDAIQDEVVNRLGFDLQQTSAHSKGELVVSMGFLRDLSDELGIDIRIHPTTAVFNEKLVDFNDAIITYRKDRIVIDNFGISEEDMLLLGVDGVASKSEADNVRLYFNNTEIANILAAFNVSNFKGSLNGEIFVRQALETPMIHTEALRIENITVHNDTIGTLRIEGDWDQMYSGLNLNAYLINGGERTLDINGYIPTGDSSPLPMDVNLNVENFSLYAIQPLTTSIFSELTGHLNSEIQISGSLSEPIAEGWLGVDDVSMKVAYTNVTYYISDTIRIGRDNVGLNNLVIRDHNNNSAVLSMSLSHTNFGRMAYTASISLNDFMLLNNETRTDLMAYGRLRLTGDLNITGSPAGIFGDGDITTRSLSEVTVVLPQTAKATEYEGIIYINTPVNDSLSFLRKSVEGFDRTTTVNSSGIPIVMRATVNLNPMLTAGVVLDPTTGNALEINGEGELNINFNSKSTPPVRLYGDYVINEGKFHYNLQNLRAIDFTIREGSRLTMAGDPLNTQFNITAFLPVRADLAALSPTFATELANTRVAVNALLRIRGNLQAMDLQYDIELPESSSDIQQRVNSFINTEETKILQFAYLATTGSFIPSEGSPDLNFGSSVFTKFAANTLSRGLDALFARALSDNWSVNTNLESVDGTLDNVRMGVDVSTRLMNNRLRISTNLSYGDNSMLASKQQFMGEFELEYDINNWLMFRAFNRANERFSSRWPTTQGVGFMVTKEGQSISNLFDFRFVRSKEDD